MFVLSHAAVSAVFALTVLLNLFYFDLTQSRESIRILTTTCQECIDSECHKTDNHTCIVTSGNITYQCFTCDTVLNGDQQFYSQSDCEASCSDKTKCMCDGACYMCVITSDPTTLICGIPTTMVNDSCAAVPYTPPVTAAPPSAPTGAPTT